MKQLISYDQLKAFGAEVAVYLKDKYPQGNYHLVAITRGGLTLAHIVAYQVAKPVNFFVPAETRIIFTDPNRSHSDSVGRKDTLVFIEDLIAKGRTYAMLEHTMRSYLNDWELIPVVIDAAAETPERVSKYMVKTADWMVFPHEDFDRVVEKDWGMFRNGTSENSKAIA